MHFHRNHLKRFELYLYRKSKVFVICFANWQRGQCKLNTLCSWSVFFLFVCFYSVKTFQTVGLSGNHRCCWQTKKSSTPMFLGGPLYCYLLSFSLTRVLTLRRLFSYSCTLLTRMCFQSHLSVCSWMFMEFFLQTIQNIWIPFE